MLLALLAACSDATLSAKSDPPSVTITSPGEGATFKSGQPIPFTAVAGGGAGPVAEFDWFWSAGSLGDLVGDLTRSDDGATFLLPDGLPAGEWTVTALVTDAEGAGASDDVDLVIVDDLAPSVHIVAPTAGATVPACEPLPVYVVCTDDDEPDLTALTLTWSGLPAAGPTSPGADGVASFDAADLPEGPTVLSVVVTDPEGATGAGEVNFTVEACLPDECNGVDDDGDGQIDEDAATSAWYADADGDGHGDSATSVVACAAPEGWLADADDCNDDDPDVYPGAAERCNGRDDDCDGDIDEGAAGDLLFGMPTSGELYRAATDGSATTLVLGGLGSISAVEVDAASGQAWIGRWDAPVVHRMAVDGTGLVGLYNGNGGGGQGVAVDAITGSLYWGEYYGDLWVAAADGSASPSVLVSRDAIGALIGSYDGIGVGLETDPAAGMVYFFTRSNAGASGRHILRVRTDGTGLEDLRQIESQCLDVDRVAGHVYFADYVGGVPQMWRIDLDGGGEQHLFDLADGTTCSGLAVDPAAGRLYYLQDGSGTVWSANLDGSDHATVATGYVHAQGLGLLPCGS